MSKPAALIGPRNTMPLKKGDDVSMFNHTILILNPKFPLKAVRYTEDGFMFYEPINFMQPNFPK